MSGRVVAAVAAAAAVLVGATAALSHSGGIDCPSGLGAGWSCRTVTVPVARPGAAHGHVALAVARWSRPGAPSRGTVIAFSGGPGGASLPQANHYRRLLAPLLAHRDLVVFDQRGTGSSGRLHCAGVEGRLRIAPAAVAACGRRLGARGVFSRSADSARDADDVRRALKIRGPMILYGVSYGTKTATDYARLFPTHVAGLVLDSVVVADTDPLYRRSAQSAARVLRALCRTTSCRADPVADLVTLVRRARGGRIHGRAHGRSVSVSESEVLNEIVEGGDSRKRLPAALRAAVRGDLGPLRALVTEPTPDVRDNTRGWLTRSFSATTYLATTCDDASFPWPAGASLAVRRRNARRWLAAQPDLAYAPFDHLVADQYGVTKLCLRWPAARRRALLPGLPDVPAILLSGEADALTPLEGAREVAAELPRSRLVIVPVKGHVVLGTTGRAAQALDAWAKGL